MLVVVKPGHRGCVEDADTRELLARAAFEGVPHVRVERDGHAHTVDSVRGGRFGDAAFVVGADEGAAFSSWKEPDEMLRWVKLAVGSRSGYSPPDLRRYGDRVVAFHLDSPPISSSDVRSRIAAGQPVGELVPPRVAKLIEERGLYSTGGDRGYTRSEPERT